LLTVDVQRNTEEMITPFCPPYIKKGRRKAKKFPRIKINSSRIRDPVQKTPIISTTRNNLPWFNQIREVKADEHTEGL
jgi:hypothetical protein